jgi:hypothetical protein
VADGTLPIARVTLARDARRLLAVPLLLALAGGSAMAAGLLIGQAEGLAVAVGGGIGIILALVLAAIPFSVRVDVEVGGLRIRWLGGSRQYHLVRGPVTRVSLTGPSAGGIKSRFPVLGWSVGRAMLRREEPIVLVRLARTPSVIVVPTDAGRLAIAAASEPVLLEALGAAARVQQRLDEVSGRVMAAFPAGISEMTATPAQRAAPRVMQPDEPAEEAPRFMTGIERAELEERLAAAREAALLAAEAERQAALEAAEAAAAKAAAVSGEAAMAAGVAAAPLAWPRARKARERRRATWTRPEWATDARLRVLATMGWAAVPLLGSLVVLVVAGGPAVLAGEDTGTKTMSLALTLGGPGAALGVVIARAWWPELTGLVASSGLAALVLTIRAIVG